MSYVIQAAGMTDIGLVRKNNEDNFGYDLRHGIFVVSDGMGGQQAGELASKIAVDTVLGYYRQRPDTTSDGVPRFEGVSQRAADLAAFVCLVARGWELGPGVLAGGMALDFVARMSPGRERRGVAVRPIGEKSASRGRLRPGRLSMPS